MSASVNLMTERAKFMAAGARIGNAWAGVVLGLLALLIPLGAWTWHRRDVVIRQREALDASYEPIRQLSAANRAIGSQAADFVARERATLSLARRRPFVAVLQAVSEAVLATDGSTNLEALRYLPEAPTSDGVVASSSLVIEVSCVPSFDMTQLVDLLNRPPFTDVKIQSNSPGGAGAERKLYVLQCEL